MAVLATDDHSEANIALFDLLLNQFKSDLLTVFAEETAESPGFTIQDVMNSFEEVFWIKDTQGKYIFANQSAEKAWRKSTAEVSGKTDHQLFDTQVADLFIKGDQRAIDAGKSVIVAECEDFDLSSNKAWLETLKSPIYHGGKYAGVLGFTRDIAKHKAAEEQLMLAACVFENAVEGVVVTDKDGVICDVNQAFTQITGYRLDEVVGKNPNLLSSGRHSKQFFAKMWNTLLVNGKWHGEIWNRRKNGSVFPQAITLSAVYGEDSCIKFFVGVFADISLLKQTEEKLKNLAYVDPLTGLPNRMRFVSYLEQEISHALRGKKQLAILCIDIDLFKHINESLGHLAGDEIIVELSKRLSYALSEFDVLARLGSDEFVVLLPTITDTESVFSSISHLRRVFERPFIIDNAQPIHLTASIGVSLYPNDGLDADGLLRNVDAAMHRAKSQGRNGYAFYTEGMTAEAAEQLKLQSALHQAIINNDFHLVYQPKIHLASGQVNGFEALIRWYDPKLGQISPADFIPLAEKIGLINEIGLWVLKTACIQGVNWLTQGLQFSRISVNVASLQLQKSDFVDKVRDILLATGLPAKHLDIEVTESCMMTNQAAVIKDLRQLSAMGISISIDDFGTGYSSLNYLKKLPLDTLKIDQSFVKNIPFDSNNCAIAKAVIALGHALNLQVIAEGVETQQQADFLLHNNCDLAQGYLYSKPKLAEDLNEFLIQISPT
ncbi:sensor domain-containing protein [Shewanella subflava]|uniref:EAL domain-containing protein n=1 Tax=Shewanella subflava TaxID=2986476 RepID=A0ABT3I6S5_9GAMM|nr:EAL domain-containing protein [Shewanella subflava]MCW3171768.1 EAL domain-containing protein [Shewanella subflava]